MEPLWAATQQNVGERSQVGSWKLETGS